MNRSTSPSAYQTPSQRLARGRPSRIVGLNEICPADALFPIEGNVVELHELSRNSAQLRLDSCEQVIELTVHQRWVLNRGDTVQVAVYAEETGKLVGIAYRNRTQSITGWRCESGTPEAIEQRHAEAGSAAPIPPPSSPLTKLKRGVGFVLIAVGGLVFLRDTVTGFLLALVGLAVTRLPLIRGADSDALGAEVSRRIQKSRDDLSKAVSKSATDSRARRALYVSARRMLDVK